MLPLWSGPALVRTVLGDISPAAAGHVQPHEHVLCDMSRLVDLALTSTRQPLAEAPLTLDNYDAIRRVVLNRENLRLASEQVAVDELREYVAAGGGTVVDSSSVGLRRDPQGLARVSQEAGVHIVMGSGYYVQALHPPEVATMTEDEIAERIALDINVGVGDSMTRAGMIGEIGLSWPIHPDELKVLRGACRAQQETGAALQIHPGRSPQAPIQAMELVLGMGIDPSRVIMSHVDRTLWRHEQLLELAATGCYLELDLFGQESSYYAFNPDARRPNDRTRIQWLEMLADRGHGDRLLISQDICQKVYLRRYGGPGYRHILESVIPLMRRMGWSDVEIYEITRHNPVRAVAMSKGEV